MFWLSLGAGVAALAAVCFLALWQSERSRRRAVETHFAPVNDAVAEVVRCKQAASAADADRQRALEQLQNLRVRHDSERRAIDAAAAEQRRALEAETVRCEIAANAARRKLASLEEDLEAVEHGVYKPHFEFDSSETYKRALTDLYAKQKAMVQEGIAVIGGEGLSVGGDTREGERLAKQYRKLLLRAFNGEADAVIAKVSWTNYRIMLERLESAFNAINKLGTVLSFQITHPYLKLKREELRLTFEEAEKKEAEREEQRRIRAQMREEERVQRELERARRDAEEVEHHAARALARAREEVASATTVERIALEVRIRELESRLATAHEAKERAIAQAQLTRVGHVYIISNVGSFGEDVFKIGMTRRLDPNERIDELGDASVPFPFDVHAMVYSTDAPALEYALHDHFWERRVNRANDRKEFFRVDLDEIADFVRSRGLEITITKVAAAKEWRLSLVASETRSHAPAPSAADE
jgi:hypothetical protein